MNGTTPEPGGLLDARRLSREILDGVPGGIVFVLDLDLRIVLAEGDELVVRGYDPDNVVGRLYSEVVAPEVFNEVGQHYRDALTGETVRFDTLRDGSSYAVTVSPLTDDGGKVIGAVSVAHSISEQRRLESVVSDQNAEARQSERDLMASERELRLILDNIPDAVSVQGRDYRYRLINDAFAERFGVAREDVIGHLDEEVLSPEAIGQDRATHAKVLSSGERVQQEEVVPVGGEDHIFQTVKFPLRDGNGDIYAVCGVFNDITDRKRRERELQDRLTWTERIHSSLAQDRLVLYGQPIMNLATGDVDQAELLVRMKHHQNPHVLVPPGDFLPAAERLDLISLIDQWVVSEAIEMAHDHRVEINLSGLTISDPQQVAEIEQKVDESSVPRENLVFEITETAVAENLTSARHFAERLRGIGCLFALDDFGVGFGTFTYLKHLPVDYLKIDIEFVRDLIKDETNRQIVSSIVGAAQLFGMKTIAEGVEDQATLDALIEMDVDYAQGYWVGRPIPTTELWAEPAINQ